MTLNRGACPGRVDDGAGRVSSGTTLRGRGVPSGFGRAFCGVGASGFISPVRYRNTLSVTSYLQGKNRRVEETVKESEKDLEFLMLNLRLEEGFSLEEYKRRFRRDFLSVHGEAVKRLAGRLVVKNGRVCIHPDFLYVMDGILLELI